ncbi:MAG TPA: hypothetical protein VN648_15135, partial [Candidatus Methylomirabilis sp.]|nr:hypothetical protein [Candidatus Methylomirabilis sp.]
MPSYANPRADLHTPHLIKPVSAAFLIEIGADFLIGIILTASWNKPSSLMTHSLCTKVDGDAN